MTKKRKNQSTGSGNKSSKKKSAKEKIDKNEKKKIVLDLKNNDPNISFKDIEDHTGNPQSTAHRWVQNPNKTVEKSGPQCIFDIQEENLLKEWIFEMQDSGNMIDKDLVIEKANKMIQTKTGNTERIVSDQWYRSYRERHPDIVRRVSDALSHNRQVSDKLELIEKFFQQLQDTILKNNLLPQDVYNCDESGVIVNSVSKYTLAKRGSDKVYTSNSENRTLITVLACGNASGSCIPPFFIHGSKSFKKEFFNIPNECKIGISDTPYMTQELFKGWFETHFLTCLDTRRPKLLILDGHSSHVNIDLLELAKANSIIIMNIVAHTSHLYQPLDVGVFSSFKKSYKKLATNWQSSNPKKEIPLEICVNLIYQSHQQALSHSNLTSGFSSSFIYPCVPHLAYELVKKPSKETTTTESNNLYTDILTIHNQHTDDLGIRIRIVPPTFIITGNDFLNISKKQTEDKYNAEIDKELRKTERKMNKKEKKKKKADKEVLQLQREMGKCCSCHKLCNDEKKCACLKGGHSCSASCTCKAKCKNPNNQN